jgi:hypothetical protein
VMALHPEPIDHEVRCSCSPVSDHERWNYLARGESPRARLDRAYAEILQEVRIAQCGVQILLAFLLGLSFTTRFQQAGSFQHATYVVALVTAASALAMLIAPTSFNRLLHRHDLRRHLVRTAHRCAMMGLALLLFSVGAAAILVLSCVLESAVAGALGAIVISWFVLWWFAVPLWSRRRHDHSTAS